MTFFHAFTAVFIVLIGENWNNIMYSYVLALNQGVSFFFIAIQIFGNQILLNLFLTILLENFEEPLIDKVN